MVRVGFDVFSEVFILIGFSWFLAAGFSERETAAALAEESDVTIARGLAVLRRIEFVILAHVFRLFWFRWNK
jgi:hypothetical protein